MEDTKNQTHDVLLEKTYTEEDFEKYKEKLSEDFLKQQDEIKEQLELEIQKAGMNELERTKIELEQLKEKCKKMEDDALILAQKNETSLLLEEADLDGVILDVVYTPLNMDETKRKIEILKDFKEKIKMEMFQDNIDAPVPSVSAQGAVPYDAFVEGFDTNRF